MTTHTKTPWAIEGEDSEGGIPFIQIIRDVPTGEDFKPIARIDCSLDEKRDVWFLSAEDKANAAHIVKCVNEREELIRILSEMHDALKDVIGAADNNEPYSAAELDKDFSPILNDAYEILNKAKE